MSEAWALMRGWEGVTSKGREWAVVSFLHRLTIYGPEEHQRPLFPCGRAQRAGANGGVPHFWRARQPSSGYSCRKKPGTGASHRAMRK